jgi:two-component system sensor histidine kinase/response regulator
MSRPELKEVTERAVALLQQHQQTLYRRTDRLFAGLMVLQWLAGIAAAYWIAPLTWIGTQGRINPTVWAAVLLGGFVSAFPIALALRHPGRTFTRHVIAAAQLMMSGLLIHFTGGRIETHFHIFGSLAFLAFYRDWPVLITASVVTAADHYLRGNFWPQSLYGVTSAQPWRWLEHSGWVVFTDIFLIYSIVQSRREMWDIACRRAETETADAALQEANDGLEIRVKERTVELTAMIRHNQLLLDAA